MRILVVDDIPTIADGVADALGELENDLPREEIQRLVAYSGEEALAVMENQSVDVLVSDVRMPKITGIDLLREAHDRWPDCRVVFLSAHDEFSYAQEALRLGASSYVLKVEGDEKLVAAVREAVAELRRERDRRRLRAHVERQLDEARPHLRQDYLRSLLEGGRETVSSVEPHELGIEVDLDAGIRLVLGRVDSAGDLGGASLFRPRVVYAVASLLSRLDGERFASVDLPGDRFALLIQDRRTDPDEGFVALLEQLQVELQQTSGARVSFAIARRGCSVPELPDEVSRLRAALARSLGALSGAFIVPGEDTPYGAPGPPEVEYSAREPFHGTTLDTLRVQLENRNRELFFDAFGPLYNALKDPGQPVSSRLATFHAVCSVLLAHIDRTGISSVLEHDVSILFRGPAPEEMDAAGDRIVRIIEEIFRTGAEDAEDSRLRVVRAVREYVDDHLDTVSLTEVGDHIGLNPSYLSRLYREATGEALSAYVADRRLDLAKQLLDETDLLVQAIALEVGYQSPISFDRFFKGRLGVTPQEYRDR